MDKDQGIIKVTVRSDINNPFEVEFIGFFKRKDEQIRPIIQNFLNNEWAEEKDALKIKHYDAEKWDHYVRGKLLLRKSPKEITAEVAAMVEVRKNRI